MEALEGVFEQSTNLNVQKPASGTAAAAKKVLIITEEEITALSDELMESADAADAHFRAEIEQ